MEMLDKMDSSLMAMMTTDHRVDGWFLMSSTKPLVLVLLSYLLLIYVCQKWMKNRAPLEIKRFMTIFNLAISLINFYIVIQLLVGAIDGRYNWVCQKVHHHNYSQGEMRIASALHLYFVSKLLELLDTLIYIVRKNKKQFDFVHVYHHLMMAAGSWMAVRMSPSGAMFFVPLMNASAHAFLYLSFAFTLMGPQVVKLAFWKKHLSIMLIVQYAVVISQTLLASWLNCGIASWANNCIALFFASIAYAHLQRFYGNSFHIKDKTILNFIKYVSSVNFEE